MQRTRERQDYRALPITVAVVREEFDERELRENRLLKDILEGNLNLEQRLDDLPRFQYEVNSSSTRTRYEGSTIEELRKAWKEGHREVEVQVTESLLSRMLRRARTGLEGVLFDKEEEVVVNEEPSLEEKRDKALTELKEYRRAEKESTQQIEGAKTSLRGYLMDLESRYAEDRSTLPRIARFADRLRDEIEDTRAMLGNGLSPSEEETYRKQVMRGQDYFNSLVNQMGYLRREVDLLAGAKSKYSRMLVKLNSVLDHKEAKLRESLVKIKEAELTQDLGVIIDASEYFVDLDNGLQEIGEINEEAGEIIDAALDAINDRVDYSVEGHQPEEDFRDTLYDQKSQEFDRLYDEVMQ